MDEPHLTFAEHLDELRRRLGISVAALLVGVGIAATQLERIVGWLRRPAEPFLTTFAYFTPTEPLVAYVKVAGMAGFVLAMPVILAQLWGFVKVGLTREERAYGTALIGWGSALFVAGAAFAYYGLLPISLRVLLGVGRGSLQPVISIDQYLTFITTMVLWCGLLFELPVVLFLLGKVGIVTSGWLRQHRSYAILTLVILAAVITPTTDPLNLLLMTAPLVGLYELSILVTRFAIPARRSPTPPSTR